MPEEQRAHQRDQQQFLDQLAAQIVDRALDQARTVVDRHDLDARRQRGLDGGQSLLDGIDHRLGVFAVAHDDDAAHGLALAIELGDAIARRRPEAQLGDIAQQDGLAVAQDAGGHCAQRVQGTDIADAAHHVLALGHLQAGAAGLAVGAADGRDQLVETDAVGLQTARIDHGFVLADKATDAGDFGHARHALQLEAQAPVLQRAQFREVVRVAAVDQRVLVDPTHAGGVRAELRFDAFGQLGAHLREVLQHARACPVQIGAVLEQHIDEGIAVHRKAAHGLGPGHGQHARGDRIGDLVFDDLRRLPGVGRADDDLHIGQVGNGIERQLPHRDQTGDGEQNRDRQYPAAMGERGLDQAGDHGVPPVGAALSIWLKPPCKLASASSRNCPEVTMRSPSPSPSRISTSSP